MGRKLRKYGKIKGLAMVEKVKKYPQNFDVENHIKTVDIVDN